MLRLYKYSWSHTGAPVQLQSNSSDMQVARYAHQIYKDEQTLFQHLEIITILISTRAYEKILETLWSAVTNESFAAVIR